MKNDIEDVKTLTLKPGQILVVKLTSKCPTTMLEQIKDKFSELFPDNKVLVIDSSMELMVIDNEH